MTFKKKSLMKVVLLISYSSMKKKNLEWFEWFLTQKIDFESQNFAIFTARFLINRWSAKGLLQWESSIYHSFKLGFEGQIAKKFLNGIYYLRIADPEKTFQLETNNVVGLTFQFWFTFLVEIFFMFWNGDL